MRSNPKGVHHGGVVSSYCGGDSLVPYITLYADVVKCSNATYVVKSLPPKKNSVDIFQVIVDLESLERVHQKFPSIVFIVVRKLNVHVVNIAP